MTVTAVMLTGDVERRRLAEIAIECFKRQTHEDAELLIVNHSGQPFDVAHERVRELMIARPQTLGELRNVGLENANGDFLISWDDDDWHHPRRIETQIAGCDEGYDAVVLGAYLVLDLATGKFFGRSCRGFECGGCCGTILHRRSAHRYEARAHGEDTLFVRGFRGRVRVLDNPASLYIRTYSGLNVSSREHVVERPMRFARSPLTGADRKLAQEVLRLYPTRHGNYGALATPADPGAPAPTIRRGPNEDGELRASARFREQWRRRRP